MGCPFAGGDDTVVTGCATTVDLTVSDHGDRCPTHRGVTGVALIRGIDVAGILARRHHAIVTTLASTHGLVVIDRNHWCPGGNSMTGGAHFAAAYVCC